MINKNVEKILQIKKNVYNEEILINWKLFVIGIGVIYLSLVDLDGHTVVAQPCYPSIKYDSIKLNEQKERLNEMLLLKPLDSLTDEDTCMSKFIFSFGCIFV